MSNFTWKSKTIHKIYIDHRHVTYRNYSSLILILHNIITFHLILQMRHLACYNKLLRIDGDILKSFYIQKEIGKERVGLAHRGFRSNFMIVCQREIQLTTLTIFFCYELRIPKNTFKHTILCKNNIAFTPINT